MAAKFEIYKDKAGEFRFRLKAGNGENILASEGYKAKASCVNGIESVKKNSKDKARFDVGKTKAGKFRFNVKSTNGQVVGTSQSYATESSCNNGVACVMKDAPGAAVEDNS
ncbi:MAG: YegP family protein [Pseudomonadota bacterium]